MLANKRKPATETTCGKRARPAANKPSIAKDKTLKALQKNPFQVKITASNSRGLHAKLLQRLPNISLFSHDWFLFVFENFWYEDVETQLVHIDRCVASERRVLCPPVHRIWRWAEIVSDPMDVRVVIVGQDPYTQVAGNSRTPMADGLAFSVSREYYSRVKRLPPSLANVLRAVHKAQAGGCETYSTTNEVCNGNLEEWCRQGVLLLNDTLTAAGGVGSDCANSHKHFGWQYVTNAVIARLGSGNMPHRVFFMLWGSFAQQSKLPLISLPKPGHKRALDAPTTGGTMLHAVFRSHHPSPLSVNRLGEFPHEQFTVCNKLLEKDGMKPICW